MPGRVHEHGPFDTIVAADVLEHVRDPDGILVELCDLLAPGGLLVVSVPNIAHWYPRLRVVSGRFDYDARGILDRDHVRFFTRRSFGRLTERSGWRITSTTPIGLPFDVVDRGGRAGAAYRLRATVGRVDGAGVRAVADVVRLPVRVHARAALRPRQRSRSRSDAHSGASPG